MCTLCLSVIYIWSFRESGLLAYPLKTKTNFFMWVTTAVDHRLHILRNIWRSAPESLSIHALKKRSLPGLHYDQFKTAGSWIRDHCCRLWAKIVSHNQVRITIIINQSTKIRVMGKCPGDHVFLLQFPRLVTCHATRSIFMCRSMILSFNRHHWHPKHALGTVFAYPADEKPVSMVRSSGASTTPLIRHFLATLLYPQSKAMRKIYLWWDHSSLIANFSPEGVSLLGARNTDMRLLESAHKRSKRPSPSSKKSRRLITHLHDGIRILSMASAFLDSNTGRTLRVMLNKSIHSSWLTFQINKEGITVIFGGS